MARTKKLLTKPTRNAHLVQMAFDEAQKMYGPHWHLFSPGIREALVRSEAFNVILRQVGSEVSGEALVRFTHDVVQELNARENEGILDP